MKKVVNYAIIGFGEISKKHIMASYHSKLLLNLPFNLNLKTIFTRQKKQMPDICIQNETDIDALLNDDEIDFVSICTPNKSHYEILKKCIDKNKKIYCEKPLTDNLDSSLEICNLLEKNRINIGFGLTNRYLPCVNYLKKAVESGLIGDIIKYNIKYYHKSYLGDNRIGSWKTSPENGKGAILDLGVHVIDLARYCFGEIKDMDIQTRIFFPQKTKVDEIAYCDVQMSNGVKGDIEISRIYGEYKDEKSISVYGTKGNIKIKLDDAFDVEYYDFEKNSKHIIKASSDLECFKYFPKESNSLGAFQDSHTASMIGFVYEKILGEKNNVASNLNDMIMAEKWVDKA